MSKKLLLAVGLTFNSLIPYIGYAENTPASENSNGTMTKSEWLKAMMPMLPQLICKGFMSDTDLKKRFDELKITYDQCMTYIPESSQKCQDQLYSSIPDTIDNNTAGTWGKNLGECIGKDFAEKHLMPKS